MLWQLSRSQSVSYTHLDIKYIPPTTKADLRDNYPFGMFAVPMSDIVRIHASSVSYTNLDVYKRQNQYIVFKIFFSQKTF